MSTRPMDGRHRTIVRLGNPVLRAPAEEVGRERFGTRFLRDLGRDLLRTMFEDNGVGLAAPQVGAGVRVFAYYLPGEGERHEVEPRVLVNPVVTLLGEPSELGWEGCLSVPGLRGMVARHPAVKVSAYDTDGNPLAFEAEGFHARVIQHEQDHLDGMVFLDRMTDMSSLMFEEEWEQHAKEKDLPVEV
ncbi:MAG TPA: peptide deformylase [Thermoanaerobaculaceae bacterium]|nr:peptide deformylase [Thermoanaerobaculaceae bacterium]